MDIGNKGSKIGGLTFVIFWFIALAILAFMFRQWHHANYGGIESVTVNDTERKVSIRMSRAHQYHADGTINNIKVSFVVDTGANSIAVPKSIADKAGLRSMSDTIVETASGRVKGSLTRIKHLTLGPIQLANIRAVILPVGADHVLLGMSALKKLKLDQSDSLLTLTQPISN